MGGLFVLDFKEPNNDKSSQNSATGIWTLLKSRGSDEEPWQLTQQKKKFS